MLLNTAFEAKESEAIVLHINGSKNSIKKSQSIVFQLIEIYKAEEEGLQPILLLSEYQTFKLYFLLILTDLLTANGIFYSAGS